MSSPITPVEGLDGHVCASRSECARTGDPLVDAIVNSPVVKKNVDHPVVVRVYDVPYGAGGSVPLEDPTTFVDRHVPLRVTVPRRSDPSRSVSFDPAEPYVVHENPEQDVMDILIAAGVSAEVAYKFAHYEVAEVAEGAWYEAHDVDRDEAERQEDVFLRQIQHEDPENPPPNLYRKPYPHGDLWAAQHEEFVDARPTVAEIAECRAILEPKYLGRETVDDAESRADDYRSVPPRQERTIDARVDWIGRIPPSRVDDGAGWRPVESVDELFGKAVQLERRQRDAFGYMEPSPDISNFAQCSSCLSYLEPKKNCYWFSAGDVVEGDDSCILYVQGTPCRVLTVNPVQAVRPEVVSFASGQTRCENCDQSSGDGECNLFAKLNEMWPEAFDLDVAIEPRGCCNAFGRATAVAKVAPPVRAAVRAAGVAYVDPSGDVLFVRQSPAGDHAGEWCLPGGCVGDGETFAEAAAREFQEETGGGVDLAELVEVAHRDDGGVDYVTFLARGERFEPVLDEESDGAVWAPATDYPRPMHPGLESVVPLVAAAARGGDPHETFSAPVDKADTVGIATGLVSYDQSSASRRREIMPWAANSDLPDSVKNNLPDEAQTVFRTVANRVMEGGGAEVSAIRQAWTAVKNGWTKGGDGNWTRNKVAKAWSEAAREAAAEARQYSWRKDKSGAHHLESEDGHRIASVSPMKDSAGNKRYKAGWNYPHSTGTSQNGYALRDNVTGGKNHVESHMSRFWEPPKIVSSKIDEGELMNKGTTVMDQQVSFFMPLTKKEPQSDGSVVVTGYASTPTKDLDGEIISLDAVKKALPAYMEWRNVRAMHRADAVGTAKEANVDDRGLYLKARVVEPGAVHLVNEGVYQGFSIGGRKLAKTGDTVTDLELVEISIVDRPCNPDTRFAIAKGAKVVNPKRIDLVLAAEPSDSVLLERSEIGVLGKLMMKLGLSKTVEDVRPTSGHQPMPSAAGQEGEGMDVDKRDVSDEERASLADQGHAMPDGSFPVKSEQDLRNAIQAHGRAKNPAAAKRHIVRQAKRLNATHLLPEGWSGSTKSKDAAVDAGDLEKAANLYTVSQMIELLGRLEYLEEVCEGEDGGCCVPVGMGTSFAPPKEFTDKFGALVVQLADCTAELLDMAISQMKDEEAEEAKETIADATFGKAWSEAAREAAAEARQKAANHRGMADTHRREAQDHRDSGRSDDADRSQQKSDLHHTVADHYARAAEHFEQGDRLAERAAQRAPQDSEKELHSLFDTLALIAKSAEAEPRAADQDGVFADLKRSFSLH